MSSREFELKQTITKLQKEKAKLKADLEQSQV